MNYLIETPRLGLRHFCMDDLQDFFELGSDPEVIRYAEKHPLANLEEARKVMIEAPLADYEKYGYGRYAVVLRLTGEVIGFCGMKYLPEIGQNELGYRYKRKYWGQGLGTEAGSGTLDYAATRLGMDEAIALILDGNSGSERVAQKLGMRKNGTIQIYGETAWLYETRLPAPDLPVRAKLAP